MSQSVQVATGAISLTVVDGIPATTSNEVAKHFGKAHDEVLRRIRNLLEQLPDDFNARTFAAVEYIDTKGESRPAYRLTRDGFTLLAMGFTGKKALQFKLAYIDAFNQMEAQLSTNALQLPSPTAPNPLQLADALGLSLSVAAAVQQLVAQSVLQGDTDWKLYRWELSFAWDVRTQDHTHPVLKAIPLDALVLSKQEVMDLWADTSVTAWDRLKTKTNVRTGAQS